MSEPNDSKTAPKTQSEQPAPGTPQGGTTPPAGVPPLENSPAFKEATREALGGEPIVPTKFRGISRGKPSPARKQTANATARKHDPLTDGVHPDLAASRQLVGNLTDVMAALMKPIRNRLPKAQELLQAVKDNPLAVAEANTLGLDLKAAGVLLAALEKANG